MVLRHFVDMEAEAVGVKEAEEGLEVEAVAAAEGEVAVSTFLTFP